MPTNTSKVATDCPPCPICGEKCAKPLAAEYGPPASCDVNELRCMACGHEWSESNPTHVAQAWWAQGAWDADPHGDGQTWAEIQQRLA